MNGTVLRYNLTAAVQAILFTSSVSDHLALIDLS